MALQYCAGFCHTTTWISHKYTYVSSLLNLPPAPHPDYPSGLSQSTLHMSPPSWTFLQLPTPAYPSGLSQSTLHMSPPSWTFLQLPTPVYPSGLSQSTLLSFLLYSNFPLAICFAYDNVYVSRLLSQLASPLPFPTVPKVCSLCLHLYYYPANRFINTIFLDSIHIS